MICPSCRRRSPTPLHRIVTVSYVAGASPIRFDTRGAGVPALATWTPEDGVLGAVAPLALACAAGTALVVDLDPRGPAYPGRTLAQLVDDGPTRDDLSPQRRGVAVLANGGVEPGEAAGILDALEAGWPRIVFRLPAWPPPESGHSTVPIVALSPLVTAVARPAVYQRTVWRMTAPGPGVVLPRPAGATVRALVAGALPWPSRWVNAWRQVWDLPWA